VAATPLRSFVAADVGGIGESQLWQVVGDPPVQADTTSMRGAVSKRGRR